MKKIKTRTKLVGAVAALTVAVALSAGTTFAWFTSSSVVTVNSFSADVQAAGKDITVAACSGLPTQGSWDITSLSYSSSVSESDIASAIGDSVTLVALTDTSTADSTDVSLQALSGYSGATASYSSATAGSDYVQFTLVFRSTDAYNIYLSNDSTVGAGTASSSATTGSISNWTGSEITAGTYGSHSAISNGAAIVAYAYNAARVSFTNYSYSQSAWNASSYQVWSPNEALYTGGEYTDSTVTTGTRSSVVSSDTSSTNNYYKGNLAGRYYEHINSDTTSNTITQKTYSSFIEGYTPIGTTAQYNSGYYYLAVGVNVWIEGTDGDCFDSILSQAIATTLKFTTTQSALPTSAALTASTAGTTYLLSNTTGVSGAASATYKITLESSHTYSFSIPSDSDSGWSIKVGDNSEITSSNTSLTSVSGAGSEVSIVVSYKPDTSTETYNSTGIALTITDTTS